MVENDAVVLEAAILNAHARDDTELLAELYQHAAGIKRDAGDMDACWFLTTHAYVFALEVGHPDAEALRKALKSAGRDE